ncbi:hypothetical protein NMG60_11000785 [Bertholletia excelsa]
MMPFDSSGSHNMSENNLLMNLPMLESEPMKDFSVGFHLTNHVGLLDFKVLTRSLASVRDGKNDSLCGVNNTPFQEQSASETPTNFAVRYDPQGNLNELETSKPSARSHKVLRASASNDYSNHLNPAFPTSVNYRYDRMLDGMNNKWELDKFLAFHSFQLTGNINHNGWSSADDSSVSSTYPSGFPKFTDELSLKLITCEPSIIHGTSILDQCSEISYSDGTPIALNEQRLGLTTSSSSNAVPLSSSSYRRADLLQFLLGSRYLSVVQEILAEIATHVLGNLDWINYSASGIGVGAKFLFSSNCQAERVYAAACSSEAQTSLSMQGQEVEAQKKQLSALLQEIDEQYIQCLDEIHKVASTFPAATVSDPLIHAQFALQTISSLYKNLRERISTQILAMATHFDKDAGGEEGLFEMSFIQKQWTLQQLRRKDQQLWRPQRGLPERSVSVLRAWMFENFLHPYPKDAEKHLLAVKSGLTRSQVSNWFINARVRLWKPMIEEMYAEMNKKRGRRNEQGMDGSRSLVSIGSRRFGMD